MTLAAILNADTMPDPVVEASTAATTGLNAPTEGAPTTAPADAGPADPASPPATDAAAPPISDAAPPNGVPVAPPLATLDPTPVAITAGGMSYPIPGATRTTAGDVTIPVTAWENVGRTLARGIQAEATFRDTQRRESEMRRELNDAKEGRSIREVEADETVVGLLAIIQQDPTILSALQPHIEMLQYRVAARVNAHKAEVAEARGRPDATQVAQENKQKATEGMGYILQGEARQKFPQLFADQRMAAFVDRTFTRRADQYITFDAKGTPQVKWDALSEDLQEEAEKASMFTPPSAPAAKAAVPAAAAMNAAAAKPAPTKSPSVSQQPVQPRNDRGQFAGRKPHPDMPTDPGDRAQWIDRRMLRGQSIFADE